MDYLHSVDRRVNDQPIVALRSDVAGLIVTVATIAEDVKGLKENVLTVKLDLARYRGALIGGMFVITALSATISWAWSLLS